MSEDRGDNIIDGILIVVSGALFTLGALAITAAWGKGSRMLRERRGIPIWKRTNKTGIQKPDFARSCPQQKGAPSKGKRTKKDGTPNATFRIDYPQKGAPEEGRWGRLPGEGILLEARGFPKGKRTNNDGGPNLTFNKTPDQQEALDKGTIGRPLGSKNKPKK